MQKASLNTFLCLLGFMALVALAVAADLVPHLPYLVTILLAICALRWRGERSVEQ